MSATVVNGACEVGLTSAPSRKLMDPTYPSTGLFIVAYPIFAAIEL